MKKQINHIDGWLYVGMAVSTATIAVLNASEAQQLFSPSALWLCKSYAEILGAAFLAGKTYRSTTFAKIQDKQENQTP